MLIIKLMLTVLSIPLYPFIRAPGFQVVRSQFRGGYLTRAKPIGAFPSFRPHDGQGRASKPSRLQLGKVCYVWDACFSFFFFFCLFFLTGEPCWPIVDSSLFQRPSSIAVIGYLAPPWTWAANEWSFCLSCFDLVAVTRHHCLLPARWRQGDTV